MVATVATRAGAAIYIWWSCMIIASPYHFGDWEYDHSGTGIDAKDSDLVGGASSPCTYVTTMKP